MQCAFKLFIYGFNFVFLIITESESHQTLSLNYLGLQLNTNYLTLKLISYKPCFPVANIIRIHPLSINSFIQNNMFQQQGNIKQGKCCCDCGTRIVIDQQLLQQRQMWKQKYLCLQRQMSKDIGQLKQTIYTQCSTLMQQQFQNKQKQHAKVINKKSAQIQSLTSKIITLQTTLKVMTRQKQLQDLKFKQIQDQTQQKDKLINMIKTQTLKNQNNWGQKLQEDMVNFRRKVLVQNKQVIQTLQTQSQHLKHKLKDFQKKYQVLIPQVQRLRASLNEKGSALDSLQQKHQKMRREQQKQLSDISLQKQQIEKTHSKCRAQIMKLNQKIAQLQISVRNQKKTRNQVKVEPIYIQRPVHVERIVQRIVPVQRVIKEYIQPQKYQDQALQHEYKKLKVQNDNMVKQNHILECNFQQSVKDYEKVIKDYQANILKYKGQRQSLARKIEQLNRQLDIVYSVKQTTNIQKQNHQPQTVKVYVKNDGNSQYYSTGTTIPRVTTAINGPRTFQRSTSRNKTLSTSQSNKRVNWK